MTTIILGWDGLDYDLAERWGLLSSFGPETKRIETYANPAIGEPHTQELWPSMITGKEPTAHGIRAVDPDSDTVDWESDWLRLAAKIGSATVPQTVRSRIGHWLRNRGASIDQLTPADYDDRGLDTIFDGRRSRAISVPNYRTATDRQHGMSSDRAQLWHDVVVDKRDDGYEPAVSTARLDERLTAAAWRRLGLVEAARQREYDLIWCWLGYLDSVGHLAPGVDERGWQRRHYERAAAWTRALRERVSEADTVVCVSDHGLRDGQHTAAAVIGGPLEVVAGVEAVDDVRAAVASVTPASDRRSPPPVRDAYSRPGSESPEIAIEDQLADLGYIEVSDR